MVYTLDEAVIIVSCFSPVGRWGGILVVCVFSHLWALEKRVLQLQSFPQERKFRVVVIVSAVTAACSGLIVAHQSVSWQTYIVCLWTGTVVRLVYGDRGPIK